MSFFQHIRRIMLKELIVYASMFVVFIVLLRATDLEPIPKTVAIVLAVFIGIDLVARIRERREATSSSNVKGTKP